jgi:transposase
MSNGCYCRTFSHPRHRKRGGQWKDDRTILNGIFWRLNTGTPWRDLPERYGPWQTVYSRFANLRQNGTFERIIKRLQFKLNTEGFIDPDLFCIDGSNIRAAKAAAGAAKKNRHSDEPADHALGRSRGGFGSKVHLVCDGNGLPLAVEVTAGQRHESTQFERVLNKVRIPNRRGRPRCRPVHLAGDKGYSYPRIRGWLRRYKIKDVIPRRSNQKPDRQTPPVRYSTYRRRAVIEQCVGWLKECRAVATRFDKLAINYKATVQLAMIQRYVRILTKLNHSPNTA